MIPICPKRITDDSHLCSRIFFQPGEDATEQRLHSNGRKDAGCQACRRETFRRRTIRKYETGTGECARGRESLSFSRIGLDVSRRNPDPRVFPDITAPAPKVVVIPAQAPPTQAMLNWVRSSTPAMSFCRKRNFSVTAPMRWPMSKPHETSETTDRRGRAARCEPGPGEPRSFHGDFVQAVHGDWAIFRYVFKFRVST